MRQRVIAARNSDSGSVIDIARRIVAMERDGLGTLLDELGTSFEQAVQRILECSGRVCVTGMGKAGLIGAKISATLSSTGTPSYTLHPVEAIHGDMGMVSSQDVVLAMSNSGESEEMVTLVPLLRQRGCFVTVITGRQDSRCAVLGDLVLNIGQQAEACPLGMAPSTSTTAMLALGDALALTAMELRGFAADQYAAVHPGGALGRSLMRVEEIMRTGDNCPTVLEQSTVAGYLDRVLGAPKRAGAALIVDRQGRLVGFFTDGDLKRLLSRIERPGDCLIQEVMTREPKSVQVGQRVAVALELMQQHRIDEVPVVDGQGLAAGLIDVQDLLARGFTVFDAR